MSIYFKKKDQEKLRELGNKVNFFQTYEFTKDLTPSQRKVIREVSYELLDLANKYAVKRNLANESRRLDYKYEKELK